MNKDNNLDQKLEYKGYWFLPSAPDTKVAGIVTYYPNEKITLELIGAFDDGIETLFSDKMEPVIYGKTSDAKDVSLIQCYQYSSLNLAAEFPIARYACNYMFVGKHIDSLDQKCHYRVWFKIPELSFWCHPYAIQSNIYFDKEGQRAKGMCLSFNTEYRSENDIISSVDIDDETSILLKKGIDFDATTCYLHPQLEQYTYVEILKKNESSIHDLLTDIHVYEDFISLATLSTVKSSEITFFDDELYQQCGEDKYYKTINFIRPDPDRVDLTGNIRQSFLFDYSAVKDIYSNVINAWYNVPSELYPIRSHLIDSLKKKQVFDSVDFLILIQAVEGFWWRFRDAVYNNPKKGKVSLKLIITELVNEFKEVKLLTEASMDIDAIVDSRHYYSHFLPKSKKPKTLDGIKLFEESKKLRILLICCILSFVGFNNSQIDSIFQSSHLLLL
jgi:hypothetical protein